MDFKEPIRHFPVKIYSFRRNVPMNRHKNNRFKNITKLHTFCSWITRNYKLIKRNNAKPEKSVLKYITTEIYKRFLFKFNRNHKIKFDGKILNHSKIKCDFLKRFRETFDVHKKNFFFVSMPYLIE